MFMALTSLHTFSPSTLAFGWPSGGEWIILLILGLLIFGRRLPEVGRSLGRGIVEFKKGIRGIEDEIDHESARANPRVSQSGPAQELPRATAHAEPSAAERNPYAAVEQPRQQ